MRPYTLRAVAAALLLCPFLSVSAITRNWVGSVSSNWSEPNNWSPAGVPTAADSLVFPSSGSTTKNDLPAPTTVGPIHFSGGNNNLSGNALTVTGTIDFDPSALTFVCSNDLKLGASISIIGSSLNIYSGTIDVNGQTLNVSGDTTVVVLNGSGTVNAYGPGLGIGSGNFSGNISGNINGSSFGSVDVNGSLANANITARVVSGNATVGAVSALKLWPGHGTADSIDIHSFGTLHTNNLAVTNEYAVDLSATSYDSTVVTGTVSIAGSLLITLSSTLPSVGQAFTIIANDGSDAVSGTFTGLPEGALLTASGIPFTISYHGGGGNDVVLTAQPTTEFFTGNAGQYWSNSANWNPQVVPVAGQPLIFFNGVRAMVNDLPAGTAVGTLTFQGGSWILSGNSLTLMGDVTFDVNQSSTFICSAPLKIGAALTMNGGASNTYDLIDVNGQTLTFNNVHPIEIKALNGSGTVNANALGIQLDSDGSFSGTLTGTWNVLGSLPNANVNGTTLAGTGTVGNVVVSNLRPGSSDASGADVHKVGSLRTKSLTITQQYSVDLTPGTDDGTFVAGTVTLTGASLAVSLPSGSPPVGTPITIISNDGSDPVVGTFTGLPEGGTLTVNGTVFTISYHGGDGNDVTLTAVSTLKSWIGADRALWSVASNWSPQAVPVAGEPLLFPIGTGTMTNDLPPGSIVGAMTFKGGNVIIEGNALTLMGDVSFDPQVTSFGCAPLTIGKALTLGAAPNGFFSAIDVNGKTLTVNTAVITSPTILGRLTGSGTIELTGPGVRIDTDGTFTGAIHGSVEVIDSSLPNASITGAIMTGRGGAGDVIVKTLRPGFGVPADPDLHSSGVLHMKSLTLTGGGLDVDLDRNGAGEHDLVQVTGSVSLNGILHVSVGGVVPILGQSFLIIDKDGTDPINGTFTNLPEGAGVQSGNFLFRVSYIGGDGNDVVLTTAEQPVLTVSQAKAATVIGEKATFTASFAAGSPSPLGSITFAVDGAPIGTVPIVSGSASIDVSSLALGDRVVTASFAGGGAFLAAASVPLTHTVQRGGTSTTLEALGPLVYGASQFHVSVAVSAPAVTTLSGSVTLRENGNIVGTATLSGTGATLVAPSLRPGLHLLIASYDGSSTLLASESRPLTVSIAPAETQLAVSDVVSNEETKLTVVASASGVTDIPTGTVTVTENGNTLAVEPINGTTSINLTLNPGVNLLTVTYSGDANFLSATVPYTVTIGPPSPSRHRGVRH
ncbi:MAG TPA: Ig-like domain-containing protein [Thermoanaerobaculia bacterium]|nr:Ig-like domain-containing protein [Thermoanaerobaculia bacterium]